MKPAAKAVPAVKASAKVERSVVRLAELRKARKALETEEKATKAEVIAFLEAHEAETLYNRKGGKIIATYTEVERESLDEKAFETDHPRLYKKYARVLSYMRLLIK
jgi:predicted phage-related endonuclease